jgi:hypothetical protein
LDYPSDLFLYSIFIIYQDYSLFSLKLVEL